jgi:hypothetical protein
LHPSTSFLKDAYISKLVFIDHGYGRELASTIFLNKNAHISKHVISHCSHGNLHPSTNPLKNAHILK